MATIRRRGKSFQIRVNIYNTSKSMTWTPPTNMTEKQALKEAERQAFLFEEKIRNGEACNGKIHFEDFTEQWFRSYAEPQLRPRTVARYRELARKLNDEFGSIPLEKLRPMHIMEFYARLRQEAPANATYICCIDLKERLVKDKITKSAFAKISGVSLTTLGTIYNKRPISRVSAEKIHKALKMPFDQCFRIAQPQQTLSPTTIQHYHRLLSSILTSAVEWQYIPYNPCQRIPKPKASTPDIVYLDDLEVKAFMEAINQEPGYYRRPVTLLLLTGLRRGELLGLEWQDVDWNAKTLRVERSSLWLPNKGIFTDETKNTTSRRTIMLSSQAIKILHDQWAWQMMQANTTSVEWTDCGRIVTTPTGMPMNPNTLSHWFAKFVIRHNLPAINIHSLRHTYATLCIAQGASLPSVAAQLGHSSIGTTAKIYAHAIQSAQRASTEAVGCLLDDFVK